MIVAIGRVVTDDDRRDELIRVGQRVAEASRHESGCVSYRVYEDVERRNEFVFVEEWDEQEDLDAHFETSHVQQFMSEIFGLLAAPPDVHFHTIESSAGLPGT